MSPPSKYKKRNELNCALLTSYVSDDCPFKNDPSVVDIDEDIVNGPLIKKMRILGNDALEAEDQ